MSFISGAVLMLLLLSACSSSGPSSSQNSDGATSTSVHYSSAPRQTVSGVVLQNADLPTGFVKNSALGLSEAAIFGTDLTECMNVHSLNEAPSGSHVSSFKQGNTLAVSEVEQFPAQKDWQAARSLVDNQNFGPCLKTKILASFSAKTDGNVAENETPVDVETHPAGLPSNVLAVVSVNVNLAQAKAFADLVYISGPHLIAGISFIGSPTLLAPASRQRAITAVAARAASA